jgi:glycosyltransferase involved in cell wall biosynthesis
LIARANAVVCNSYFTARTFLETVPYPRSKVFVAHNGADERFFNPHAESTDRLAQEWSMDHGEITVVFAGALVEEKGPLHAIEAVRSIMSLHQFRLRLIIVGSSGLWRTFGSSAGNGSDYEQQLRDAARDLPVHFAGALSRDDMPNALALADIVVVPSLWEEPFGTIVCEAMAAAKAVVAYRSGGIVETVVDGETGFLVPKGDIGKLTEAILLLAGDVELRAQMGSAGRKRARDHFTWERTAGRLDEIYRSILD